MLITTFCLAAPPAASQAGPALTQAAADALAAVPGLRQVQALRVLRHIPTDSVPDDRSHTGVVASADRLAWAVECSFDDAAAAAAARATPGWQAFLTALRGCGVILFSLDTQSNVPIAPAGLALDGGFRRWMLLARKADTAQQFRDAWFGHHADLVKRLPHVDGYLQNLVTARYDANGNELGYDQLPIDGVAQLCFADEAAMNAAYTSEARLPLRDDGRALLGRITTVLVQGKAWR